MQEREAGSQSGEVTSRSSAPPPQWQSGYWWRCRHLHVPVIVWILASVLGGAAIGSALEPDAKGDKPTPTSEVLAEPVAAADCNENYAACVPVAGDVDCAGTEADVDPDVDNTSYMSEPVEVVGRDVYALDSDNDGIACD
ncbi:MAG TPA: hypothetical protein VNO51_14840 [Ilumatobacteraceae bacterium]|nr:hypothetical protein [Ilumatobacteraceae bacterium]